MRNLLEIYRKETIAELLKIYVKSCILKEYFFVFPFLTKISFKDDDFYRFIANKLKEVYFSPVSIFLENETQFFDICKTAMSELQDVLESIDDGKVYDLVGDFANLAFIKYQTESEIIKIKTTEDDIKYETGNMFLEYYIRLEDSTLVEARDASEIDFLNRPNRYRGVVNVEVFDEWINSISLTQDRFLALVPNRYLGVRLIYISPYHDALTNRAQLYQSIITTEPRYVYEKTNALAFVISDSQIEYKFPLILAKKETLLPSSLGSLAALRGYVQGSLNSDVFALANRLVEDDNFSKLFNYHFPVKIMQGLLYTNFVERYTLLKDVYVENKLFQDLSGAIINLLTRIKFAEDPTNI